MARALRLGGVMLALGRRAVRNADGGRAASPESASSGEGLPRPPPRGDGRGPAIGRDGGGPSRTRRKEAPVTRPCPSARDADAAGGRPPHLPRRAAGRRRCSTRRSTPPLLRGNFPAPRRLQRAIPPDTHGAVGPNQVMVMLNTQFVVQDRTGGTVFGPKPLNLGVAPAKLLGNRERHGTGAFDPRVVYDPTRRRGALDLGRLPGRRLAALAAARRRVSKTESRTARPPTDRARHRRRPGGPLWADYPSVGFTAQWVVVQVNIFRVSTTGSPLAHLRLRQGPDVPGQPERVRPAGPRDGPTCGGTQVPAVTYDSGGQPATSSSAGTRAAATCACTGSPGPWASRRSSRSASRPGTAWADNRGRRRLRPTAPRAAGVRVLLPRAVPAPKMRRTTRASRTSCCGTGSCGRPTPSSSPSARAPRSSGGRSGPTRPVDPAGPGGRAFGDSLLRVPQHRGEQEQRRAAGLLELPGDEPAGARYALPHGASTPRDAAGREPSSRPARPATTRTSLTGRNRWGDYSATVVDPDDDKKMWTIQEYAAASLGSGETYDRWGTWWGMLDPTPGRLGHGHVRHRGRLGDHPGDLRPGAVRRHVAGRVRRLDDRQRVGRRPGTATSSARAGPSSSRPGRPRRRSRSTVKGDTKEEPLETLLRQPDPAVPRQRHASGQRRARARSGTTTPPAGLDRRPAGGGGQPGRHNAGRLPGHALEPELDDGHRELQRGARHCDHRDGVAGRPQPRRRHSRLQPRRRRAARSRSTSSRTRSSRPTTPSSSTSPPPATPRS